jgi:hypothetical protein
MAARLGVSSRSLGSVLADAAAAGDEDARYQDALATIEKIERARAGRAEAQRFAAEQMAAVRAAGTPTRLGDLGQHAEDARQEALARARVERMHAEPANAAAHTRPASAPRAGHRRPRLADDPADHRVHGPDLPSGPFAFHRGDGLPLLRVHELAALAGSSVAAIIERSRQHRAE